MAGSSVAVEAGSSRCAETRKIRSLVKGTFERAASPAMARACRSGVPSQARDWTRALPRPVGGPLRAARRTRRGAHMLAGARAPYVKLSSKREAAALRADYCGRRRSHGAAVELARRASRTRGRGRGARACPVSQREFLEGAAPAVQSYRANPSATRAGHHGGDGGHSARARGLFRVFLCEVYAGGSWSSRGHNGQREAP